MQSAGSVHIVSTNSPLADQAHGNNNIGNNAVGSDQPGGIANLEGMTFGPRLPNGKRSLVVVADDNFPAADSATDRNQMLVFEIQP